MGALAHVTGAGGTCVLGVLHGAAAASGKRCCPLAEPQGGTGCPFSRMLGKCVDLLCKCGNPFGGDKLVFKQTKEHPGKAEADPATEERTSSTVTVSASETPQTPQQPWNNWTPPLEVDEGTEPTQERFLRSSTRVKMDALPPRQKSLSFFPPAWS